MAIDTFQAAKYLAKKSGWKYTNLELQKLLYIAHMIHLGKTGEPLFEDAFEAWNYGPVIPGLYYFLKSYLGKAWEIGSLQQRGSQIEPILSLRTSQGVKTTTLGSHIRPQPLAKALLMAGFQYLDILILCHLHR